jgi:hypothetical protein
MIKSLCYYLRPGLSRLAMWATQIIICTRTASPCLDSARSRLYTCATPHQILLCTSPSPLARLRTELRRLGLVTGVWWPFAKSLQPPPTAPGRTPLASQSALSTQRGAVREARIAASFPAAVTSVSCPVPASYGVEHVYLLQPCRLYHNSLLPWHRDWDRVSRAEILLISRLERSGLRASEAWPGCWLLVALRMRSR